MAERAPWDNVVPETPLPGTPLAVTGERAPWDNPLAPTGQSSGMRTAEDVADSFYAGVQASSAGLVSRGEMPNIGMPKDPGISQRLPYMLGGVIGDVPAMMLGGALGMRGGPAGMAAGAFAAPMALREALVEAYGHDDAYSWQGLIDIAKAGAVGFTKGAITGLATFGAGAVAGKLLPQATTMLGKGARMAGITASELTALTTTAAGLEGHFPTWQDFMDNAILLGGMKGAIKAAKSLRAHYADTGMKPEQAVERAKADPEFRRALLDDKVEMPKEILEMALEERVRASLDRDAAPEMIRQMMTQDPKVENAPKLGESPFAKVINWDYIVDQPTFKALLSEVEGLYATEIAKQTRGVRSNKATFAKAAKLAADGEVVDHIIGRAENAEQIAARAMVLRAASDHVFNEFKRIKEIPEAELTLLGKTRVIAAVERLAVITAEYRGVRAEVGRAMQILQAIKRDASEVHLAEDLVRIYERKGSLSEIARYVEEMKDPIQLQKYMEGYRKATTIEKGLEAWKAGILSGPLTHLANWLGNQTRWFAEIPEQFIATSLEAGRRAKMGDPMAMAQFKAKAFNWYYGLKYGFLDALKATGEVLRNENTHLEKADVFRHALEGTTGKVVRSPFRALQAMDVLYRTAAERGKAYELAVDRAIKEGLDPRTLEFNESVMKFTNDPVMGLTKESASAVMKEIHQAGGEAVFAQRLGPRLEQAQRAFQGSALGFVMPFIRTPVNLISWAMQHTPGLNLLSSRWRADFAAGGPARSKALARVIMGTVIAETGRQLALEGIITGGGQFDPELRRTKMAAGWQPYSFKIGDKYYSYQRLEPIGKVLGIAADLVEMIEASNDEHAKATMGAMLVGLFGNAMVSTTYLSGISSVLQALNDPTRYVDVLMEQYASSLVPKIVGQTVALADEYKREIDGVTDAIASQLPWLRQKLLPKRDVWGDPVQNKKLWTVLPVASTEQSRNKVKLEAERLQVALSGPPKFLLEAAPLLNQRERRIELTMGQKDVFTTAAGKKAMELLAPMVDSPEWNKKPDLVKIEIIQTVFRESRRVAQYVALPPGSQERVQKREEIMRMIEKAFTTEDEGAQKKPSQKRRVEIR